MATKSTAGPVEVELPTSTTSTTASPTFAALRATVESAQETRALAHASAAPTTRASGCAPRMGMCFPLKHTQPDMAGCTSVQFLMLMHIFPLIGRRSSGHARSLETLPRTTASLVRAAIAGAPGVRVGRSGLRTISTLMWAQTTADEIAGLEWWVKCVL